MLHRLQRRARLAAEDGAALLMVLMLIMVTATLSILVLGLVLAQVKPSQFAQKNSRTVFAAEAGIEAALGEIRSSLKPPDHSGAVYGDRSKLPCTVDGPVVSGTDNLTYSVAITYYKDDPSGKDPVWLAANKLACNKGYGTLVEPSFAILEASGTANGVKGLAATAGNRSISTIYAFQVTNVNVSGGLMYNFDDSFCLRADAAVANAKVRYTATCNGGDDLALWVYDTDYGIKLASTVGTGAELCITGASANLTSGQTVDVSLQLCNNSWNQFWSYQGGANFRSQRSDNTNYSSPSACLWAGTSGTSLQNRTLQVGTSGCTGNTPATSFSPEPMVGPGAAGYNTNQIVNYLEFGRCFDVTNENPNSTFMIIYPCKQDPSGGSRLCWNHRWYYVEGTTSPQRISINYPGGGCTSTGATTQYCLQAPTLTAANPRYVRVVTCSTTDPRQQWVRYGFTGDYKSSYTFVDTYGRCASVGPKAPGGLSPFSTIVVATCSGGPEQKWNAPPGADPAAVKNFRETTSG